jgi:hypothetical protein
MTNAMPFENAGNRIFYLSKKIKNRDQEGKGRVKSKKETSTEASRHKYQAFCLVSGL